VTLSMVPSPPRSYATDMNSRRLPNFKVADNVAVKVPLMGWPQGLQSAVG
jgi:hypothetical protein